MTRYERMFANVRAEDRLAFGAFFMLGYPSIDETSSYLDALVESGADMVELGIPFSDPVADGPVIARAGKIALEAGVTPDDCLGMLAGFRRRHPDVPVGVLTYANIVMARGRQRFAEDLAAAGADSLLVADVPSIEAESWALGMAKAGIAPVLIAAPNTPRDALERIAALGRGYTYCVARQGVTGTNVPPALSHAQLFEDLARLGAAPPILGFGISKADHVAEAAGTDAAGVIVGSALIASINEGGIQEMRELCGNLRAAC